MLNKLLRDMQVRKQHIAIVLDEFGGTAGLLTFENVIEELVGNIQDEYDDEKPLLSTHSSNQWDLDASISIDEANETLPVALPESEEYETIGGLVNSYMGRIASPGDRIQVEAYSISVLESSKRRVERVRISLLGIDAGTSSEN
jgi:CBS domain containing-hemolysin-like protein